MNETCEERVDYLAQLKHAGKLWYLVSPYESSFQFPHEVPDYQVQVWLPFFVLIVLEQVILFTKSERSFRLNDHVTSLSHWLFQEFGRTIFRGAEYYAYIALYENYRICSLPWDSPWTWYVTVIGVDFCYYWVHRANHGYFLHEAEVDDRFIPARGPGEVHLLWAQHQVHHSSEEFNLVVGLRQSFLQHWCSFVFYLPLASMIPPSHFIAHHQFNLIYQLWIHTTVVKDLGPLELIFNTPKHHRVHHGCNLYCLDKNYGGVFIIWDRLFGTFEEESPKEKIIFGLVSSPQTFNPLYLQTFYTKALIEKSLTMKGWSDKFSVLWKGPSWMPGLPRLGLDEFKIKVTSRVKYDPNIQTWRSLYATLHFCMVFYTHVHLYGDKTDFNGVSIGMLITNNVFALTSIGLLFDGYKHAAVVELFRCTIYLMLMGTYLPNSFIFHAHLVSCCIWIVEILRQFEADVET